MTNGRDLPSGKHDVIGIIVIVIKGGLGDVAPQEDYLILIKKMDAEIAAKSARFPQIPAESAKFAGGIFCDI